MKGDFSRDTYYARHHFTRVLMQQGRVQLDADWNEQAAIVLHYLRTLAGDLIGPHGGPEDNAGYEISVDVAGLSDEDRKRLKLKDGGSLPSGDFLVGKGHYFVGGILCENEQVFTYLNQPDFVVPQEPKPEANASYVAYLDVWERHVTTLEHQGLRREVALGGPDTASRQQLLTQVKVLKLAKKLEDLTPDDVTGDKSPYRIVEQQALLHLMAVRPKIKKADLNAITTALEAFDHIRLRARAYVPQAPVEPCTILPEARYRRPENQLYRVEIHRSGPASSGPDDRAGAATFKWSRENGCVVFPIEKVAESVVTLAHTGRDARFGLEVGDYVEVVDDEYVLQNRAEPLLRVKQIDHVEVTLDGAFIAGHKAGRHRLLRRWDH
jgi:hypothetical protein